MTTRILSGDCRDVLKTLPDASVQCVVTSPPYYGLRSYLPDGHADKPREIGLEATPDEYVAQMVAVFSEIRRVLRDDGTIWLVLGDSYSAKPAGNTDATFSAKQARNAGSQARRTFDLSGFAKPKDLLGIPWRVAFALQSDGWWLRSDIIWHKPSPMPESVTSRPTSAHEHVFLLAKSGQATFWVHRELPGSRVQPPPDYRWVHRRTGEEVANDPGDDKAWRRINLWRGEDYFYDADAIAEDASTNKPWSAKSSGGAYITDSGRDDGGKANLGKPADGKRNARNVWTIATEPYSGAHFACMPTELAERCIKAGTSERGCCAKCGAPLVRQVHKGEPDLERQRACGGDAFGQYYGQSTKGHDAAGVQNASDVKRRILEGMRKAITTGWAPSCGCDAPTTPCIVLDPFFGAGSTGLVCDRLGRDCIGIDLNPEYARMATDRITDDAPLFAQVQTS